MGTSLETSGQTEGTKEPPTPALRDATDGDRLAAATPFAFQFTDAGASATTDVTSAAAPMSATSAATTSSTPLRTVFVALSAAPTSVAAPKTPFSAFSPPASSSTTISVGTISMAYGQEENPMELRPSAVRSPLDDKISAAATPLTSLDIDVAATPFTPSSTTATAPTESPLSAPATSPAFLGSSFAPHGAAFVNSTAVPSDIASTRTTPSASPPTSPPVSARLSSNSEHEDTTSRPTSDANDVATECEPIKLPLCPSHLGW